MQQEAKAGQAQAPAAAAESAEQAAQDVSGRPSGLGRPRDGAIEIQRSGLLAIYAFGSRITGNATPAP